MENNDKHLFLGLPMFSWAAALRRKDFAAIADWFYTRFLAIGAAGMVFAGLAAWADRGGAAGLRVLALSLLFGAACMVSGWLLGLRFGVPRTLARPGTNPPPPQAGAAPGAADAAAASRVNTNLEDISDWLTKTIVGVGLTQLLAAPTFLWSAAGKINAAGFAWGSYGQLLALGLFFYFAPGGFWLGYVGTRTILTKLFDSIDRPSPASVAEAGKAENLKLDPTARRVVPASDGLAEADRVLLGTPLQAITTPKEMAAWGAAKARSGDLAAGQTALEEAYKMTPNDTAIRDQLATVYVAAGRRADADRLTPSNAVNEVAVLNALYEKEPEGFTRAITLGEQLAARPGADRNASLHTWLAAAYGQKYGYRRQADPNDPELPAIRTQVLREVRAALDADPTSRVLLHSLWKPAGALDDDLSAFAPDDPELSALLEPA
jgi:hypothetical protein